jgi:hypothetical protein
MLRLCHGCVGLLGWLCERLPAAHAGQQAGDVGGGGGGCCQLPSVGGLHAQQDFCDVAMAAAWQVMGGALSRSPPSRPSGVRLCQQPMRVCVCVMPVCVLRMLWL